MAWHTAAFTRAQKLASIEDYLRPDRHVIPFDDDEALAAALDRVVAQHSVMPPAK